MPFLGFLGIGRQLIVHFGERDRLIIFSPAHL
jgi:hypothetical protein